MTDVRDADAPALQEKPAEPRGDFIWYELLTTDIAGAKSFYDAVVGWNIQDRSDFPNDYRMIGRSDGKFAGGAMQLTDEMKQHGARPTWLGYILVPDVDASVAAIQQDGGQVHLPAFDIPGVGRIAMVTDPQGAPFYIMKPLPPQGDPNAKSDVFSPTEAQRVRWNELSSTDPDAAIDFYKRQFGWTQEGAMPMGEMGDYRFIQANGANIGAIMRKPPQRPVSAWNYYIGVDDIDRATHAVTDGGGQILNGPHEIPGGEYSLNGMDPQGAAFGLVGPRK
jgi:predicted enzyme related to lactoylglutathione lyase